MTLIRCGVDASSATLDARVRHPGEPAARFANDAAGIPAPAAFCRRHDAGLVVMEDRTAAPSDGGYERTAFGLP